MATILNYMVVLLPVLSIYKIQQFMLNLTAIIMKCLIPISKANYSLNIYSNGWRESCSTIWKRFLYKAGELASKLPAHWMPVNAEFKTETQETWLWVSTFQSSSSVLKVSIWLKKKKRIWIFLHLLRLNYSLPLDGGEGWGQ